MNKKAFTLVELILIIVIIGVILVFALPNITSTLQRNKKDVMIEDAKDMIEKAKNYMLTSNISYPTDDASCNSAINLSTLDPREEIKDSPFGSTYNRDDSYVKVCKNGNIYDFKVKLIDDDGNNIGNGVDKEKTLEELTSDKKYTYVVEN